MNRGKIRWIRRNLFATPFDSGLTLLLVPLCLWALGSLLWWAAAKAEWRVVTENLRVLMVGTFPGEIAWRAWAATLILSLLAGASYAQIVACRLRELAGRLSVFLLVIAIACTMGSPAVRWAAACSASAVTAWLAFSEVKVLRKTLGLGWLVGVVAIFLLLMPAGVERWGGLLMSILVTLIASVASVPLGILLAFGRRSRFASARILCTAYIETMRSLPLILIVYCVWIVVPLLSPYAQVPDLARGVLGFVLFFAAYVAEYVRSGLQSVPKGQVEAALSLGMSGVQVTRDIVLPQATRVVMPALVGNVLDIFNTVPLLFIIGLTDFLRASQMILVNPQSGSRTYEIYIFMFAVYLAVASAITYASRRLETRMAAGHR